MLLFDQVNNETSIFGGGGESKETEVWHDDLPNSPEPGLGPGPSRGPWPLAIVVSADSPARSARPWGSTGMPLAMVSVTRAAGGLSLGQCLCPLGPGRVTRIHDHHDEPRPAESAAKFKFELQAELEGLRVHVTWPAGNLQWPDSEPESQPLTQTRRRPRRRVPWSRSIICQGPVTAVPCHVTNLGRAAASSSRALDSEQSRYRLGVNGTTWIMIIRPAVASGRFGPGSSAPPGSRRCRGSRPTGSPSPSRRRSPGLRRDG
jgi:hypothetical protein